MLSSERRGSSARRGMTVLGKIPAVPKPINLPSQRLENRGLDPNVELVPRGSVSWGSTGRSPPTSSNAWGTPAQASSPPSSGGAWGSRTGSTGGSGVSGGGSFSGPGNIPRPSSGGSGTRPTSGGPGARPSSAEGLEPPQQSSDSFSSGGHSSGAWGARPSSASGVLGQAQPQLAPSPSRPRSADIARPNRNLSEFGDQSGLQPSAGTAAWGNRGPPRRLGEEAHQVSRFQLTRTDFPTLGSEKNPDLRPQQSHSGADRGTSVEAKVPHPEDRGPPTPPGPHEDGPAHAPGSGYGHPDRGASESWRREFQGPPPPGAEGNWHRDGPPARPSFGGPVAPSESWRRESGGPSDDNWRRGGAPPVGQYGPPPGPGHFAHEGPGFMHQGRFGPGPAGFGRGAPGPGGYGHPGEMYGNSGPLLRPGGPMHGMRPNMFPGPVPYEGFYGPPPGAGYQGMEDPERMMMGPYGGFAQHRGPPPDAFGRFPHGGMNQGPRHPPSGGVRERERGESVGGDGYHDGPSFHKDGPDGAGPKEGRVYGDRHGGGGPEGAENRRFALHRGGGGGGVDVHGQGPRGGSSVPPGGHRDWGAAASSDEPMDFSKPVFEEEVVSASPLGSGKQSPSPVPREESSVEEVKREDVSSTADTDKSVVEVESAKDEEKKEVLAVKSDAAAAVRSLEGASSSSKSKVGEVSEGSVPLERKFPSVVDKEVVARVVTKEVPGKWERSSKRGDGQLREVIGPGSGGAAQSSNARSGQASSVGAGKSSILGNAPRNAGVDLQHPKQENAVSAPVPSSESEAPSGVEKGRTSRRPESPRVESAVEGSVPPPVSVQESLGKEGPKAKGKSSSHDGEKEWRPKVPIAEASPRGAPAAVAKAGVSSSSSGPDVTEESGADSESGPKPGSYDYDEQRLKMKEIAAQRARQLQKEEEERIKDQKAKARAKLEELDRRSTVVPSGSVEDAALDSWKPSVEVEEAEAAEEGPAVEAEASVPSVGVSAKRVVRNEHGKRERDRKASVRKAVVVESAKGKVSGGVALLPPPLAMAGPLLSTPAPGPEAHGPPSSLARESRHRGRPEKKQLVTKSEEGVRAVAVAPAAAFPDTPSSAAEAEAEANGGWSMDKPLPQESNSAPALHSVPGLTEGSGVVRKNKSSRHVRNRPRPEAAPMTAESIQFGDIVSGVHIPSYQPIVGGDPSVDSGSASFHVESAKDVNVGASGDALTGDEGSAVSTNGDASGKRLQRKSRSARRGPGRSDRGSLEQRAAEKSHVGDSMVWAPVRSPGAGAGAGNKVERVPSVDPPPKDESSSAQQQARAKRAEMERYTPKPLMKYQESSDHAAAAGAGPQHSQAAAGLSSAGVVPSESARATVSAESKPSVSAADGKVNSDVRGVESGTKVGKSHGSWRQRGSGSERAPEVANDFPAAVNVSGSGPADSGPPRPRAEQRGVGGHGPSRRHPSASDHLLATPPASAAVVPSAPAPAAAVVGAVPVSVPASEREHPADKKLYQPPRPGSAAAQRGQDHRVPEPRGQDMRGQDFRGQDHRGQDYRVQGPHGSEPRRHDQGPAPHSRHSHAPSDRAGPVENLGYQQQHAPPHRNGGGQHHPRSQNPDKEQAPSHPSYTTAHSQQKSHAAAVPKEPSHPSSRERDGLQEPPSRGGGQHFVESGEQVSNHRGGRPERDQASRPSSGQQRGQGHWQQAGVGEGYRSRAPPSERESAVAPQLGRPESFKPPATESQRAVAAEHAGPQASRAVQQAGPAAVPSPKGEVVNWEGAVDGPAVSRGRDYSHGRRGRFGGRSGPRNLETESRREGPSSKQRLVINATGGAVPSPVAG